MVIVLAMVLSLAPLALAEDTGYSASLCVNWWKYDYQTVSGEGVYTFTLDVSDLTEIQYVSLTVNDAYADLKDYAAYVQLKLDGTVLYNGPLTTWAQWVDDGTGTYVESNNYYAEPFNLWGGTNVVSSMPTGTTLEVKLGIGQQILDSSETPGSSATSYNATLDVDWWKFDYQTVTPGQQTTFTLDVADIAAMNHFAISIADAYADLKDYTPYLLVKVDDNTVYNGACNYWAAWVDGVETNNYYVEPYNAWNDYREIASVPAGSKLTVVLSLGTPVVEEGEPAPTATYVVAGQPELCGSEWDATDANNLMTDEDGDGVYTKEYTKVAAGWPQFKVVEVLSDGTQNWLTDQPEDWNMWVETKKGDTVTITYEPATGKITYTVTTPPALWETAYLCCAEKDTWWPSVNLESDVKVSTVVTGEGTYTLSWNLNEWGWDTVDGIQVLYIDITNYENLYMYDATNITVTADGQKVPTAWYNAKTYYADGYYRIELYNVYSNSAGVVSSDLTFAENLTVTFDLVKGQPITGDTTPVALAVCLLVLGALGVTALVATKKKLA